MAILTIPDDVVWFTQLILALFFSALGAYFPLTMPRTTQSNAFSEDLGKAATSEGLETGNRAITRSSTTSRDVKVAPGQIWLQVRAALFPFMAALQWYLLASLNVAAGNAGTYALYWDCYAIMTLYAVVTIGMILYLAFRPIIDVLEGRESLEA